jgi:hypothetical protein
MLNFADETEKLAVRTLIINDGASTSRHAGRVRRFGENGKLPRRCRRGVA